jgi:hypothetical protein
MNVRPLHDRIIVHMSGFAPHSRSREFGPSGGGSRLVDSGDPARLVGALRYGLQIGAPRRTLYSASRVRRCSGQSLDSPNNLTLHGEA